MTPAEEVLKFISDESKIPVDQLHLLNVSKEQIEKAIITAKQFKLSEKQAVDLLKKQWLKGDPTIPNTPATAKEMDLMGFKLKKGEWVHEETLVTITDENRRNTPFKKVEELVLKAYSDKHKNQ